MVAFRSVYLSNVQLLLGFVANPVGVLSTSGAAIPLATEVKARDEARPK